MRGLLSYEFFAVYANIFFPAIFSLLSTLIYATLLFFFELSKFSAL